VQHQEPIYKKYQGALSYADLYTLAGIEAIALMGGPAVGWRAGRVDSMDPKDVTPDGRLPDAGEARNAEAVQRQCVDFKALLERYFGQRLCSDVK
jgi:catalase (peroxidase I)